MAVAYDGPPTWSFMPVTPWGAPIRTGRSRSAWAASVIPSSRQPLENRLQPRLRRAEIFRHHPHVADDGHEVRVAIPPRHEVHVQVIGDAGAGRPAEIDTDVQTLRAVRLLQRDLRMAREAHQLRIHLSFFNDKRIVRSNRFDFSIGEGGAVEVF